jgi:hypothetical protein
MSVVSMFISGNDANKEIYGPLPLLASLAGIDPTCI